MRKATLVVELLNSFFKVYGKLTNGALERTYVQMYGQVEIQMDRCTEGMNNLVPLGLMPKKGR
jgi:hypothetical protein